METAVAPGDGEQATGMIGLCVVLRGEGNERAVIGNTLDPCDRYLP